MSIKSEARELWRLWSVKLAAFAGLIASFLAYDPTILPQIMAMVPEQWRPLVAMLIGFVTFATAATARRIPQRPKDSA